MLDRLIMALSNVVLYSTHPKLVRLYGRHVGRLPNIAYPRRYSERMLWRKIVDHDPQFVVFSDKLATKEYCKRLCPDLAIPKTLWIGNDADAIPDELLRGDVFVKTNHGYNFNCCIRRGQVDRATLKTKTDLWLRSIHGGWAGQWAYSQVEPKLFVEEAIGDADGDLLDFNVRAGNGTASVGSVIGHNKTANTWTAYLDVDGNPTADAADEDGSPAFQLPEGIELRNPYRLARKYAEKLSVGVDYARFDFMWNGTDLYAGEITVYPSAGIHELINPAIHCAVVKGWDLEISHFLRTRQTGIRRIYADALRRRLQNS